MEEEGSRFTFVACANPIYDVMTFSAHWTVWSEHFDMFIHEDK